MSQIVDWDELPKNPSSKGDGKGKSDGVKYLKFEDGKRYRIRLISKPVAYQQHWKPVIVRSPGTDKDGNVIDPLMQLGFKPETRYSIWILDREDNNTLKVMDFGASIYKEIVEWKVGFSEEPGGMNGPDFQIKIEGIKRNRKYKILALERKPFTQEELDMFKQSKLREKLEEIRKPNTPEEIRKIYEKAKSEGKLRGDDPEVAGNDAPAAIPTPTPVPTPVAAPVAAAPAPVAKPAAKPATPAADDPLAW